MARIKMFKVVRRHPKTDELVDVFSGSLAYAIGEITEDCGDHGLSVHTTAIRAMAHVVPIGSVGRRWPAVVLRVSVDPADIMEKGKGHKKTLVRRLRVEGIERDNIPADVAQVGLTPSRIDYAERLLADGWGGFYEVGAVTRGSAKLEDIPENERPKYAIEYRAAKGRYGTRWSYGPSYRAVPVQ